MRPPVRFEHWPEDARFAILLLVLIGCFLWGGGSRLDIPGLVILQPAAVLCLAALLLIPGPIRLEPLKAPLLLLLGLAAVMAIQLIPLPPTLWAMLPGHAPFVGVAEAAGIEQPWRPVSLTPDLTIASLTGLIVPLTVLIGFASISVERSYRLLPYLIAGAALSALLATGQVAGGPQSGLYRYEITNFGAGVGFFSNRNHQAVLLAMAFPMLALWVGMAPPDPRRPPIRRWVATAMAIFLLPLLAVTGSRAGVVLGLAGLVFAWMQLRTRRGPRTGLPAGRIAAIMNVAPLLGGIAVLAAAIILSRAEAITRLFATPVSQDLRAQYTPTLIEMAWDFFPSGSGFGSFDPVFRYYEPFEELRSTYLNHAHNDLAELIITGGLPALLILLLFLAWIAPRAVGAMRSGVKSRSAGFARLGFAMISMIFASSLVDYPLRTPLHSALFVIACGWLAGFRSRAGPGPEQGV